VHSSAAAPPPCLCRGFSERAPERERARPARGRLLTAKLLYEWAARRLGAGGIQTLVAEVIGAATGFAFAALYLDADLLAALPKTIVP
jgi:hypothetical protein